LLQVQRVCHDTLPWLISFSLDEKLPMDPLNVAMLVAFVVFVGVDAVFLRLVKRSYPEVWQELGSPDMLHSDGKKIYRYFFRRRYRDIPDRCFVLFCDFILLTQIVAFALLAWFTVSLLTFWVPRLIVSPRVPVSSLAELSPDAQSGTRRDTRGGHSSD
jgi:hypothetical protein